MKLLNLRCIVVIILVMILTPMTFAEGLDVKGLMNKIKENDKTSVSDYNEKNENIEGAANVNKLPEAKNEAVDSLDKVGSLTYKITGTTFLIIGLLSALLVIIIYIIQLYYSNEDKKNLLKKRLWIYILIAIVLFGIFAFPALIMMWMKSTVTKALI